MWILLRKVSNIKGFVRFLGYEKKRRKKEAGLILDSRGKNILFNFKMLIDQWNKLDQALKIFNIEKNKIEKT